MKNFSYLALVTAQHKIIPTNLYRKRCLCVFWKRFVEVCVCVNSQCCVDVLYKMAENKIRRQALTIQENEELAEAVRKYPCLYDKSKKEYKDNI